MDINLVTVRMELYSLSRLLSDSILQMMPSHWHIKYPAWTFGLSPSNTVNWNLETGTTPWGLKCRALVTNTLNNQHKPLSQSLLALLQTSHLLASQNQSALNNILHMSHTFTQSCTPTREREHKCGACTRTHVRASALPIPGYTQITVLHDGVEVWDAEMQALHVRRPLFDQAPAARDHLTAGDAGLFGQTAQGQTLDTNGHHALLLGL